MRLVAPAVLALLLASPLSATASDSLPDTFTVALEGDETRTAVKVEPWGEGTVALTAQDGRVEYVPMYRIRSIRDRSGTDLAKRVTRDRATLPLPPPQPGWDATRWKPFRLRAGPASVCGSYLISDCAFLGRDAGRNAQRTQDGLVLVEYGYARNFGSYHSVGVTGFLHVDERHDQEGLRLRLVQWLSPSLSLNLSPGIVLAGYQNNAEVLRPAFSAQGGLTLSGRIGLVVEMFTLGIREAGPGPSSIVETRGTAWHVGFKLGGEPGLVGTLPALYLAAGLGSGD
jgi:hypothetical protein